MWERMTTRTMKSLYVSADAPRRAPGGCRRIAGAVCLAAVLAAARGGPAKAAEGDAAKGGRPERFPEVKLSKRSVPRYMAIELSPYESQVAYLLFDGDPTNGYDYVYVWIPGDKKYDEPKRLRSNKETNTFKLIEHESRQGDEMAQLGWQIRWQHERHGGYDRRDYLTGKMEEIELVLGAHFYFALDYRRGPASRAERRGGKFPLDILIPGRMHVASEWEEMRPPLRPWDRLYYYMTREETREKAQASIHFKGQLRYHYSWWDTHGCTVRSLPGDMEIKLHVKPYLEDPIVERDVTKEEAFGPGVTVTVPYGWYAYDWTIESSLLPLKTLTKENYRVQPLSRPPVN